jgi:hypothetical protein
MHGMLVSVGWTVFFTRLTVGVVSWWVVGRATAGLELNPRRATRCDAMT